jgi:hypothetical protein
MQGLAQVRKDPPTPCVLWRAGKPTQSVDLRFENGFPALGQRGIYGSPTAIPTKLESRTLGDLRPPH